MYEPQITLTGNLGNDPKLRFTPNGTPVVDLRIATTPRKQVGEDWVNGETLWLDVSVWKNYAENISESLHKGDKVTVSGRLAQSTYTKDDGTEHTKLAVEGAVVGVDLSRCKVTVSRIVRGNAAEDAFGGSYNGEPDPIAVDEETGEVLAA
ncbi:MAG: Single-strand binding protein [Frankiales bacterium]|nr:Single-strand binding protein [Frankiales bacterium]